MAKVGTVSPARAAAFDILQKIDDGAFSSVLLAAKEPELRQVDRSLCHELVMGVLRWQLHLDKIIEHFARRKVETLDRAVLLALRLGVYQLRFLSRVPASAAVNESVNLVGRARVSSAKSFVNAVLRRAIRESNYDPAARVDDEVQRLAVQTSHPEWLIQRWITAFGTSETEAFARANNEIPPTVLRVVRQRADESEVMQRLQDAGARVEESKLTPGAWRVAGAVPQIRELAASGEVYVQDEASQLVAQNVKALPGERVLDVCAAPGGKSALIADLIADNALVVASDFSANRLSFVRDVLATQQLESVQLLQLDATRTLPFGDATFERVLVDAPCSGTGTLRRNPEIRWRLSPSDIEVLSRRQKEILRNAARVLKAGGRLIYSTCSVEPEENEEVVKDFISTNEDFIRAPIESLSDASSSFLRTWPHREGSDGFFVAAFARSEY